MKNTIFCNIVHTLTIFFFLSLPATAAQGVFEKRQQMQYLDQVFDENIRTVQLRPSLNPLAQPIIKLGSPEVLQLDFDDLSGEFTNYNYTVVHCTYDWQPSDLIKAQYIEGMQEYYLQDFEYSINTYVPYTHYQLTIPNQNMRFTISGNYLLIIYRNSNPDDVVLTRRFMIYEEKVNVVGSLIRATQLDERDSHQQLNFNLIHQGYDIPNPFLDLHVNILQNSRWDNARFDIKPKFIRNQEMDFNFEGENAFTGGNEFRGFDTKQLTELTLNVRKTVLDSNYTVYLVPEIPRLATRYSFLQDANGRFIIRRLNSNTPETEADYAWVDFYLATPKYSEGNVYVFGQLSDWRVQPRFKLSYDENAQAYKGKVLLKQGFYNYEYVVFDDYQQVVDETLIEGSHWETRNEYTILVYHREIGIRYDRLIAVKQFLDNTVQ